MAVGATSSTTKAGDAGVRSLSKSGMSAWAWTCPATASVAISVSRCRFIGTSHEGDDGKVVHGPARLRELALLETVLVSATRQHHRHAGPVRLLPLVHDRGVGDQHHAAQ